MNRADRLIAARPSSSTTADLCPLGHPPDARLLLLSPHPDDIAWSLGATVPRLRAAGAQVCTLTFFTRSRYAPGHPATDIGAVTAVRAGEERAWASAAGVLLRRGGLDDASLRGYDDETELGAAPEPEIVRAAGELLRAAVAAFAPHAVFAPGSRAAHVDHTAVRAAAEQQLVDVPLLYYDDLPYAAVSRGSSSRQRLVVRIDEHWPAKEAGMRHFASQAWQDVLPLVHAHAARVGGEQLSTDSRVGADLLHRLTGALVR